MKQNPDHVCLEAFHIDGFLIIKYKNSKIGGGSGLFGVFIL